MTFLDVSSLKHISKTQQIIKLMTGADFSNKTKTKNVPPNNHHAIHTYVELV